MCSDHLLDDDEKLRAYFNKVLCEIRRSSQWAIYRNHDMIDALIAAWEEGDEDPGNQLVKFGALLRTRKQNPYGPPANERTVALDSDPGKANVPPPPPPPDGDLAGFGLRRNKRKISSVSTTEGLEQMGAMIESWDVWTPGRIMEHVIWVRGELDEIRKLPDFDTSSSTKEDHPIAPMRERPPPHPRRDLRDMNRFLRYQRRIVLGIMDRRFSLYCDESGNCDNDVSEEASATKQFSCVGEKDDKICHVCTFVAI